MRIVEVAKAFCEGIIGNSEHLKSTGDKLISYNTIIAQKALIGFTSPIFILNTTRYSITSSKHLSYVKRYLDNNNTPYVLTTKQVPYNEQDLIKYL